MRNAIAILFLSIGLQICGGVSAQVATSSPSREPSEMHDCMQEVAAICSRSSTYHVPACLATRLRQCLAATSQRQQMGVDGDALPGQYP